MTHRWRSDEPKDEWTGSRLRGRLIVYRQSFPARPDKATQELLNLLDEIVNRIDRDHYVMNKTILDAFKDIREAHDGHKHYQDYQERLINDVIAQNAALKLQLQEGTMKEKPTVKKKVKKVMREFSEGKLHSGSKKGPTVTNPKQAVAIGYSEGRKAMKKGKK